MTALLIKNALVVTLDDAGTILPPSLTRRRKMFFHGMENVLQLFPRYGKYFSTVWKTRNRRRYRHVRNAH